MRSRLQIRARTIFLAGLVIITIIAGILTVPHLFSASRHTTTATASGTPTNSDGSPLAWLKWSSPATWQGKVPQAGAAVTIPAGKIIWLDTSPPPLTSLTIQGTLICAEKDLALSANWIMVESGGALQCGTEQQPFQHQLTITLTGNNPDDNVMSMGTKLLGVVGGRLDLHGQPKISWVHLNATAIAGTSQLILEQPVNWSAGDHLAIASTDYDPLQAEEVVVKAATGNTITLEQPLQYTHWGQLQSVAGQTVDERAEVGLLSHNIVVQGDDSSVQTGFGGQSMFMRQSVVHIANVEFYHMGQQDRLARYPVHWHLAGDATGDYIQDSSVAHSFNRCITIHGTDNLLVRENVTFDTVGHCYFMEDGTETHNLLEDNLGMATLQPPDGKGVLPSDMQPATFWITNPDNYFIGNVAAGSQGQGFWFAMPVHPTGLESNRTDLWPQQTALGLFTGDVAHSDTGNGLLVDSGSSADGQTVDYYYAPVKQPGDDSSEPVDAVFQNFTAYKHGDLAIWIRGYYLHLDGAILADNGDAAVLACNHATLENALVVGETDNTGNPAPGDPRGVDGRSLPEPWNPGRPLIGYSFYDGVVGLKNVTFANFVSNSQRPAGAVSYLADDGSPINITNNVQGAHFVNANAVYLVQPTTYDGDRAAGFLDMDGSITGQANTYVVANNPLLADSACTFKADWNSYICNHHYNNLTIESGGEDITPLTLTRNDGATTPQYGDDPTFVSVSMLSGYTYTWKFAHPAKTMQIDFSFARSGDYVTLIVPYPSASMYLYRDAEHDQAIAAAKSLDEFNASHGDKYFYDSASGMLYMKLVPQGGNDWARVNVEPS